MEPIDGIFSSPEKGTPPRVIEVPMHTSTKSMAKEKKVTKATGKRNSGVDGGTLTSEDMDLTSSMFCYNKIVQYYI
jgi:hypothetical protein